MYDDGLSNSYSLVAACSGSGRLATVTASIVFNKLLGYALFFSIRSRASSSWTNNLFPDLQIKGACTEE